MLIFLLVFFAFSLLLSPFTAYATTTTTGTAGDAGNMAENFDNIGRVIYVSLTTIGGFFLWIGGSLLDISLSLFVFNMPGLVSTLQLDDVIQYVWEFIRDLFNLLFIFGIIFIGFRIILQIDEGKAKRTLGSLLIAALLINFSLYAAQIVIDFGNITAAEIRNVLVLDDDAGITATVMGMPVYGIHDRFLAATDIESISSRSLAISNYISNSDEDQQSGGYNWGDAFGIGIAICLMFIIMGFTFAAGALLMFSRFIYLIFLMMFSPIMFLGWVLPNFKNLSSSWWKRLINQTIMGPAYLFMLLVSLRALETLMANRAQGDMDTFGFIVSSFFVAAFAWAALYVARKFGDTGANLAINVANNVNPAGLAAGGLRGTVGRWSQNYADSDKGRDRASGGGVSGWAGRRALNVTTKLGDSSFDARNINRSTSTKMGLGEGVKGGYATTTKQVLDKEVNYAKNLGEVSGSDPVIARLQTEVDAVDQAIKDNKRLIQDKRKSLSESKDEGERQVIRAQIESFRAKGEELEDEKSKQTEALSAERFRRQTGSKTNIASGTNKEIDDKKKELKNKMSAFAELQLERASARDDAQKQSEIESKMSDLQKEIAETKKDLANAEKKADKEAGGYATTVENKNVISNLFTGRDKSQNDNAATEIRNEYKKKIKGK